MRKRKLVALLLLSFGCLVTVNVFWLFLTISWVSLQFVIAVFHCLLFPCLSSDFCYLLAIFANSFGPISGPTDLDPTCFDTQIGFQIESVVKTDMKKVYNSFDNCRIHAYKVWITSVQHKRLTVFYGSPGGTFLLITYHLLLTTFLLLITY